MFPFFKSENSGETPYTHLNSDLDRITQDAKKCPAYFARGNGDLEWVKHLTKIAFAYGFSYSHSDEEMTSFIYGKSGSKLHLYRGSWPQYSFITELNTNNEKIAEAHSFHDDEYLTERAEEYFFKLKGSEVGSPSKEGIIGSLREKLEKFLYRMKK